MNSFLPRPEGKSGPRRGFALVVTLSMMILLTVVAVGLLTLSTITLRSSGQGSSMATAKANARLALMLAIGELQKTVGPDKAITATSAIVSDNPGKPNLTGAWRSWDDFRPDGTPNYDGEKNQRFQGWLVSSPESSRTDPSFVEADWSEKSVELVGSGSLGGANDADAKANAGVVQIITGGKRGGGFAWHVADESVKARVNAYRDPAQNQTLAQKRALVGGHRPQASLMTGRDGSPLDFLPNDISAEGYNKAMGESGKLIGLNQYNLLDGGGAIGKFRNDITPYSRGVLANVREGGLKKDLTSIFEAGTPLPNEFQGRLYATTHGITGVSDPNWSTLSSYYNSYKELANGDANPTFYRAPVAPVTVTNVAPPTQFYAAPVIAKVEMLFTFVVRNSHGPWINNLRNVSPELLYMGHLIYTPIVTLHNPYNVNLQFDRMLIRMENVPVGFNFFVNGQPQTTSLLSMNNMFTNTGGGTQFSIEIANWPSPTSSSPSGSITMKPGQSLLCSPFLDGNWMFGNGDDGASNLFFNWRNDLTRNIKAKPGFRGKSVGYDIDWLTPDGHRTPPPQQSDGNLGVLGLRLNDQVHVEWGVKQPPVPTGVDRFVIHAEITSRGRRMQAGGLSFIYGNQSTLNRLYPEKFRFPQSGTLSASSMHHPNNTRLRDQSRGRAFAMFSVYGRTANGGVYETDRREETTGALNVLHDGRLAGKPFLHHNPAKPVVSVNLNTDKPGHHSHEMNFQPVGGEVDDHFELDSENRTPYLLTHKGNVAKSIKSGSYLEIPSGPMRTIADFRRSNALTSSYLPNFVQPVANSYVSPLMSTSSVMETGVASYPLLDHSVLANHALYDGFYFSTFAQNGSLDPAASFAAFMDGAPLLSQNFEPYLRSGMTADEARSELFSSSDAYRQAAAFQLVKGPFNVNSTSVEAWKAVLGAMRGGDVPVLWARSGRLESTNNGRIPLPAMSLHNAGPIGDPGTPEDIDDLKTAEWNGFRNLTEDELTLLATEIVRQVRRRGPFLTMSEFVNRRIGSNSEFTRTGALQQAIDESRINEGMFETQVPIMESHLSDERTYGYRTPAAAEGNPAAGAPGWLSQGDLLKVLEPAATVRSDTFVIRTYGEATDAAGNVLARAFAEAVVQRLPDYVDPLDSPSVNVYESGGSGVNKTFGRRINIVGFRWLSDSEI